MNTTLNNKEIGKRIAHYRTLNNLSQEDLAAKMEMSRPVLSQIESGKRTVSAIELSRLANILNFSLDEIVSSDFSFDETAMTAHQEPKPTIRISVPVFKLEKFKNLILYILERCAGKANIGETVLYKLLYFTDFNYYELYEEHLSGATYRKLEHGPVPKEITTVLHNMEKQQLLQSITTPYYGYEQKRYIPLVQADRRCFNGAEIEVIDKVIDQLSGMSAAAISRYSHEDMPWKATKDRQIIDYELAFYREAPYSVRVYNEEEDDD